MSPVIIIARLEVRIGDVAKSERYYHQLRGVLEKVDGFEGVSIWHRTIEPTQLLALYHYRDVESAERGLQALMDGTLFIEEVAAEGPADVTRVTLTAEQGLSLQKVAPGQLLSISKRIADPGYAEDLAEEVSNIFAELALIPGYLGSAYGHNETLAEEVIGLVAWRDEASFQTSVPEGTLYELRLYKKVL
jgi:heme-degrading monooxygenase HmoA